MLPKSRSLARDWVLLAVAGIGGFFLDARATGASSDGTAQLQFDVRLSEGFLEYGVSESSLFGFVGSKGGGGSREAFLADYSSSSESGSFFSGVAATGGDQRISGTTSHSAFHHVSSSEFVLNLGLGDSSSGAQLLTSGRVGFSVTGLQGPTFDLHLDSLAYRFHLSSLADASPGSFSDGSARWLVELRYSLAGDPRETSRVLSGSEAYLVREGAFGFVDTSRLETASFGEIPADAIHLSLGWSTMVEGRIVLAVPELGNVTQVWVLLAGGCLGIGVFGRARRG
ncbi:MAG: hypothetical protein U1G08_03035 [Verrucomicrobiota bacterium]